jgi:hypothetical protein
MSALSPEADMLIFDHHLNASYIYEQAIWPWTPWIGLSEGEQEQAGREPPTLAAT